MKIKLFKKQLLMLKERLLKLMLTRLPRLLTRNKRLLDRLPKQFKLKVMPNRNYNKVLRKREPTSRLCVKLKLSNLSPRTQTVLSRVINPVTCWLKLKLLTRLRDELAREILLLK